MRSFEILVPEPSQSALSSAPQGGSAVGGPLQNRRSKNFLEVFVHGANITARVEERQTSSIVRDLSYAILELSTRDYGKRIVPFYDDAYELAIERCAEAAYISLYRGGADPFVIVYDRCVAFAEVATGVRDALNALVGQGSGPKSRRTPAGEYEELSGLAARFVSELGQVLDIEESADAASLPPPSMDTLTVEHLADAPVSISADFALRRPVEQRSASDVESSDLHALLFSGRARLDVRGRVIELGDIHPFVFADRLLRFATEVLEAWAAGNVRQLNLAAGTYTLGARTSSSGEVALLLQGAGRQLYTFPGLSAFDVVAAAVAFGRGLCRTLLRLDRKQMRNLRLSAFRRRVREVSEWLRNLTETDERINPSPESYRAFAKTPRQESGEAAPLRLRYAERWRAMVPGIDLRSTFLCGDRLIVGGARDLFCLDRTSGEVRWRSPVAKGVSVVTPQGIARVGSDGTISLHDYERGAIALQTWIAPRHGALPSGAVVNSPGLPKLLVVTEGERHLVALDLLSGEPRWRFAWSGSSVPRLRRAGKLLYVATGDASITAIDLLSGEVVWRRCDRFRFRATPTLHADTCYAISGATAVPGKLHAFDAYSGATKWAVPLLSGPCTVEGGPLCAGSSVVVPVRERGMLALVGYDRATGEERWRTKGVSAMGTSFLCVDDRIIGNAPTGELSAVDSETGKIVYSHAFGRVVDTDVPRRLEPILRSGALYVPHTDVHILRPSDGRVLGRVGATDAIPDLLRVDERCDVYLAEESGHVAAYGVGPTLSLVR